MYIKTIGYDALGKPILKEIATRIKRVNVTRIKLVISMYMIIPDLRYLNSKRFNIWYLDN